MHMSPRLTERAINGKKKLMPDALPLHTYMVISTTAKKFSKWFAVSIKKYQIPIMPTYLCANI